MAQARLITLEGGEGAGKTTLARALADKLRTDGADVIVTREPGGTPGADAIRALLVRGGGEDWSALTETLLLAAARRDHLERVILPHIAKGGVVICDRFIDSTYAYQVAGHGLAEAVFDQLNALIGAPTPDVTFLLDLDPAEGLRRSRGGALDEDRYERMDLSFHNRVRAAFLARAAAWPARFVRLNGACPPEEVAAAAWDALKSRRT